MIQSMISNKIKSKMNFSGQDQKTYQGNQKRRIKYD